MAARYRKPPPASSAPPNPVPDASTAESKSQDADGAVKQGTSLSVLDVLRVLGGIVLLSCGMSYLAFGGESLTWGYNAWWTRAREWKALIKGEVYLTDTQLSLYDGTDPKKPIYLALNGTIYDVSASPQTYAPGGSYHFFAGRDAARAFLTGCFQEDLTPDLRGVEMMYMPVDKPSGERAQSYDPLKNRHARELRQARKQVKEGLEHWHKVFRGDTGKPYFRVGEVVREKGWLDRLPRRELCAEAERGRPARKEE
ncbi:hypothetical protein CC78DRAFT_513484 [Lojkania enalia]|uniref:Cytochrome b5 heme-binding domain-containing protein n=1 Tax=Lojkania enalia TaxID=147567 RepID=A0A9P4N1S2_9PLEO|nr:hypothetical protein CC78DRAFT_513484 [Didymosphaeria enalia]